MVLGLLLIPVTCYWTILAEVGWSIGDTSTLPLFVYPTVALFIVVLLNQLLGKLVNRETLKAGELLVIYVMITVACSIAGESIAQGMFGSIVHPLRYATAENEWKALFFRYLPMWLTLTNKNAIEEFYQGEATFYSAQNLQAWVTPLLAWGGRLFALVSIMLCFNVLFKAVGGK